MSPSHNPTRKCSSCGVVHEARQRQWDEFEPIDEAWCMHCNSTDIRLGSALAEVRHPYSIAGAMPKMVAERRPATLCGGCGHLSIGKTDYEREHGLVGPVTKYSMENS